MTEPSAAYLHLEVARARRSVLRAQMLLASRELSERTSRMRLDRLKVHHLQKALDAEDANVGLWCDTIRHSGRPLYSCNAKTVTSRRKRRHHRVTSNVFFVHRNILADYKQDLGRRSDTNEYFDLQ